MAKLSAIHTFLNNPIEKINKPFATLSYNANVLGDVSLGSHNGDNYLAYTFFIENTGSKEVSYISKVVIDDVIKNVDAAIRVRIYKNGEYQTYAKLSSEGEVEPNTVPFVDDEIIMSEDVTNFKPNGIDKYTIVLWIEGEDSDCTDNILGGEFKVRMNFKPIDAE